MCFSSFFAAAPTKKKVTVEDTSKSSDNTLTSETRVFDDSPVKIKKRKACTALQSSDEEDDQVPTDFFTSRQV